LFTIAKNKAFAINKKKNESPTFSFDKENSEGLSLKEVISIDVSDDIDKSIIQKKAEILKKYIFELPEKFKKVLIMRELDGCAYQEIADELELNLSTVKSQIKKGRERLQKMVRREFKLLENYYDVDGVDVL
jgi:RNA polymerase sigma-70 factor (ECF subfamily)